MSLFEMSLQAAVLIVAIVIIRALSIHHLPKKTFTVLWAVALCRLLIPFSISSPVSFYALFPHNLNSDQSWVDVNSAPLSDPIQITNAGIESGMTTNVPTITPLAILLIIWIIGIAVLATYFFISYIKSYRVFRVSLRTEQPFLAEWLDNHVIARKIDIRVSDRITSPLTYGIFRPVILLPKNTDWQDKKSLDFVLTHEWTHIRRFDALTKIALIAALCIHWMNPMVWVMYILANRDIELACDDAVIKKYGIDAVSSYALTLLGRKEEKSFSPIVNHFSQRAVKERINAIMKYKRTSIIAIVIAIMVVGSVTTVFATSVTKDTANQDQGVFEPERFGEFTNIDATEILDRFGSFGVSMNTREQLLYYKELPVREIWDPANGMLYSLSAGTSRYPENAVDLTTVYDESGKLVGLSVNSQEQYDEQTEVRNQAVLQAQADETDYESQFTSPTAKSRDASDLSFWRP